MRGVESTYFFPILELLPNAWKEILRQSEEFESCFKRGHDLLDGYQDQSKILVTNYFDQTLVHESLSSAIWPDLEIPEQWYHHPVDFLQLIALPPHFQFEPAQIGTWLQHLIGRFKAQFQDLLDTEPRLSSALNYLLEIIPNAFSVPDGLDIEDPAAIIRLKQEKIEALRPSVLGLLELWLKVDLTQTDLKNNLRRASKIGELLLAEDDQRPDGLTHLLSNAHQKLPQIGKELSGVRIAGMEAQELSKESSELLRTIQQEMPEVNDHFSKVDWSKPAVDDLLESMAIFFQKVSQLFLLQEFKSSVLVAQLRELLGLIKLRGISQEDAIQELRAVFDFSFKVSLDEPAKNVSDVLDKLQRLLRLCGAVEVDGKNIQSFCSKAEELVKGLFRMPEGTDLNSFTDVLAALLANGAHTARNRQEGNIDEEDGKRKEISWLEQVEKLNVLCEFLQDQPIKISLRDKVVRDRPKVDQSYLDYLAQLDDSQDHRLFSHEEDPDTDQDEATGSGQEKPSKDWFRVIMGDRDHGVIAHLASDRQELAEHLVQGTFMNMIFEKIGTIILGDNPLDMFKDDWERLEKEITSRAAMTLGQLINVFRDLVFSKIPELVEKLKILVIKALQIFHELGHLIIDVIEQIRIPGHYIPPLARERLFPDDENRILRETTKVRRMNP